MLNTAKTQEKSDQETVNQEIEDTFKDEDPSLFMMKLDLLPLLSATYLVLKFNMSLD